MGAGIETIFDIDDEDRNLEMDGTGNMPPLKSK